MRTRREKFDWGKGGDTTGQFAKKVLKSALFKRNEESLGGGQNTILDAGGQALEPSTGDT